MATCELARDERRATLSIPGRNTYQVGYLITADSSDWGAKKVVETCQTLTAPNDPLPLIYSSYAVDGDTADLGAYCLSISVRRNPAKATQWHAAANFGPLPIGHFPGDNVANPIARAAKYWLEFETITEQITEAVNITALPHRAAGTKGPIESAAAEEFDESLFEERYRTILVIQKNFATLTELHTLNRTYDFTLNNNAYFGYPKECAMYRGMETSLVQHENGAAYYTATIRVALSREPFYRTVVNQGYRALVNGNPEEIKDDNDERISAPWLLALDGTKLPDGQLGTTIDYRTRDLVDYGGLVL